MSDFTFGTTTVTIEKPLLTIKQNTNPDGYYIELPINVTLGDIRSIADGLNSFLNPVETTPATLPTPVVDDNTTAIPIVAPAVDVNGAPVAAVAA